MYLDQGFDATREHLLTAASHAIQILLPVFKTFIHGIWDRMRFWNRGVCTLWWNTLPHAHREQWLYLQEHIRLLTTLPFTIHAPPLYALITHNSWLVLYWPMCRPNGTSMNIFRCSYTTHALYFCKLADRLVEVHAQANSCYKFCILSF